MFRVIRQFREKTRYLYAESEQRKMEPWKKKVMELHAHADFLFYFEEVEPEPDSLLRVVIRGEIVKGKISAGNVLLLLSGQAEELGRAEILSDPEEKEEKRLGLVHIKRNQFVIKMTELGGEKTETMEISRYRREMETMWDTLSLITSASS